MMENHELCGGFANISQRAVSSYLKALTEFNFIAGTMESKGVQEVQNMVQSQAALHSFFTILYANLYECPDLFGLPLTEDASIEEDEPNTKDRKQAVKRLLDKPKAMIQSGLDFLMLAGTQGRIEEQALILDGASAAIKQAKVGKKFIQGFESAGLTVAIKGEIAEMSNAQFPQMMVALQALAKACAGYEDEWLGKYLFASCDFRALDNYQPTPMDLYRYFDGEESALVLQLHEYFDQKDYKTEVGIHAPWAWVIKYQGSRKVKATPLFQIDYDDRHARPLRMQIKCASSSRIIDLLPHQSQALQKDFFNRVYTCGDCGWCRNNKTLGPSVLEYQGESKKVCWFVNGDIHEINQDTVELIEEYELMHAELVQLA
jgi:hypothetical protein